MNYQKVLCVGDSQTFGARTYGCYPLHLARELSERGPYVWQAINKSVNGHTARDLWFAQDAYLSAAPDTYQACLLIGTNDAGEDKDPDLFEQYLGQILRAFFIARFKVVYVGEIPPIFADGHVYFDQGACERREVLNARIERLVNGTDRARLVRFPSLDRSCYVDPVHFNEQGNRIVAEAFAEEILKR